ncbi:DsbA family protein [Halorubrum sp. AJ67]|uniref:DsbA family oxidoreductase n=1 Tax=Halorubrum sp. AJ67 TaxID=1173487 RepID=UPI0003DDE596|nr:DsbA family oxidoreductase [Halorubrum sp. AJ67]CDK39506.1 DSBA oxidoreductase [Halorubrum sp. AJ67]
MATDSDAASGTDEPDAITVYSDYVCPFCYLGRNVLTRFLEDRDNDIDFDWHPFDLRAGKRSPDGSIDHDADDGKDDDYYEQARENVRRLQEKYDIDMAQELRTDVDSWNAQQASLYVREEHPGKWRDFDEALFDALWTEGHDIGDLEVIENLAEDIGLDPVEIREAIKDEEWSKRLENAHREAKQKGVTGVPTFEYGGHAARGAVPPEHLERLVEAK